ncbi:hypothetical protein [Pyrococcus yayanosii]|uniref:Uncharacterized protein n=1 Tax=Pyrococcus yayanosii (strain CH1 / JCM 16557) TaxID=529709 RepID=F8AFC3_PYRYC|nr:hypothetical protein [Pyrococcus yayanosii]AEH24956.1 hypothetical protein PYCH_12840 [Pyrococcus yayanosii CH1]
MDILETLLNIIALGSFAMVIVPLVLVLGTRHLPQPLLPNPAILLPIGLILLVAARHFLSEWYGKVPIYVVEE